MSIYKAIEILKQYLRDGEPHDLQDLEDAMKLSIAALGQFIILRKASLIFRNIQLPGETEE